MSLNAIFFKLHIIQRFLKSLSLKNPLSFVLFISLLFIGEIKAQDPLKLLQANRLADDIRASYHRGDYRAALSQIREYRTLPGAASGTNDQVDFIDACSAARIKLADAEKKLNDFIRIYPASNLVNIARYELAVFYYDKKDFEKSGLAFNQVEFTSLEKDLRHNGRFYWGYGLFSQKKLTESLIQFNQLKLSDGIYGPAANYYAGFIEYNTGDFDAAYTDLKRIESQESYSMIVPYMLANILYRQRKSDELLTYISQVEKKSGVQNLAEIKMLGAEAHYQKKNYAAAISGYDGYLKSGKNADRGLLYRAGYSNFATDNFSVATEYFKQVASDEDTLGRYGSYYLGVSYLRLNQKQLALTSFQAAQRGGLNPQLVSESQYQEAKLLYDLSRPDAAIERMEDFINHYPGNNRNQELKELLSAAYVNANNYHKAIGHIESLVTKSPATDKAYQKATLYYGIELFNKGVYDQAFENFRKSLSFPLDDVLTAQANLWSAESLAITGKLADAATYYERVIANRKATKEIVVRARYGLGYVRYNQKEYDLALTSFRDYVNRAGSADMSYADGLIRLADCYYVTKSYDDAYATYRKAFETGKAGSDYARMQAGVVLGILRRHQEGMVLLDEVIQNYPGSVYWDEAVFQKAQLEFEESNYSAAATGYSLLIKSRPNSRFVPFAYVRRAAAYYNLKEYPKTADDYTTVLRNYPGHPASDDILIPLQEALGLAGRGAEFDGLLKKFKEKNPQARGIENVEFESAKNLYFNQDYLGAVAALSGYINTYPDNIKVTEARYYRAESYFRQKDFINALTAYYEIADADQFPNASKVSARIADLEFKSGNFLKAIPAFYRLQRFAQNQKEKNQSWLGLMEGYFQVQSFDSALVYANKLQSDAGASATAQNKASLMLGKIYQSRGEFEKAKDEFISTLNNAQDESGAEAKYRLAEIHLQLRDHRQCYETVIALNRDFGTYTEWVGRGFLLLAESFLQTGEVFQAKATLKSLEKFPLEKIKTEAALKLKKIESEETKKNVVPADSTEND